MPAERESARLRRAAFDHSALAGLPTAESLAGDAVATDPRDPDWAPPALTNQWAGLVTGRGVFSYAGFSTPEAYAASEHGRLYAGLDGGALEDLSAAGDVVYRWFPSRVERSQTWRGLRFDVVTLLPTYGAAAVNLLTVTNPGAERASLDLLALVAADTSAAWDTSWPPRDPVRARVRLEGETLLLEDRDSPVASAVAVSVPLAGAAGFDEQASGWVSAFARVGDPFAPTEHVLTDRAPDDPRWREALTTARLDGSLDADSRWVALHLRLDLEPGGSAEVTWAHALGADAADATSLARRCLADGRSLVPRTRDEWEAEWRAAFGDDGGRFSGHLPVLESDQASVARLYYMGALTLLYCKRTPVWGGRAETYVTGFPSSLGTFPHTWVFPWDTMMVSGVLSLLDPEALRRMVLAFLSADLHRGCAIDFRTGEPVGNWYAVNDYAAVHMAWQYVRYTADLAFLDERVRGRSVLDLLVEHARYYRRIAGEDGLADYGTAANLLECVSSYTHKVASFNAANVWNGRTVAALLRLVGRDAEAQELESTASALSAAVLELYLPGEGFFGCRQPDGTLVPVRHCLDFFTVLQCMPDALGRERTEEMVAFFLRELKTRTWMHALSPLDPDAAFSSRTDHQDEGAYTTWPAYSLEVLLQTGHAREALEWVGLDGAPGLADVTRQGPFGQAYTHGDEGSPTVGGVAAKAPMEFPHIEKPVLLPGGKYAQVVIEALAGVRPVPGGEVAVEPRDLPVRLSLRNLRLRGEDHVLEGGAA
ncbi:MAG TPA: hypothetical protein VFF08_00150 [Trueperaceae bacterium]|nr:hypothetical protein [Trueperaceae bacterium]